MSDKSITLYSANLSTREFEKNVLSRAFDTTGLAVRAGSGVEKLAFSSQTAQIMEEIIALRPQTSSAENALADLIVQRKPSLEEALFDACAAVKIEMSRVSMHFSKEMIDQLTSRIDQFHDPEDWEESEKAIQIQSLKTFIRWFYQAKPPKLPSFGMSNSGFLTASWMLNGNKDQLVLVFLPRDKIKWFVTLDDSGQKEYASGETPLKRMDSVLAPYPVDQWFAKGQ